MKNTEYHSSTRKQKSITMRTKNYSSPWQYFVETEAEGESETGQPLNSVEEVHAEHSDITLRIICTPDEWTLLVVEAQTHNTTPELLIKKTLFSR